MFAKPLGELGQRLALAGSGCVLVAEQAAERQQLRGAPREPLAQLAGKADVLRAHCLQATVGAMRLLIAFAVVAVAVGAFFAGRGSAPSQPAVSGSFAAGREAAFSGFDGGWAYGMPYIVVLERGGPGVTYRFADRRPMLPGRAYRRCGGSICVSR